MKQIIAYMLLSVFSLNADDCTNFEAIKDFDLQKDAGIWYVYSRLPNIIDGTLNCMKLNATVDPSGNMKHGIATGFNKFFKAPVTFNLEFRYKDPKVAATRASFADGLSTLMTIDLNIVDTDYEYGIIHGCYDLADYLWLYTRYREPSQEMIDKMNRFVNGMGIDSNKLILMDQSNCSN